MEGEQNQPMRKAGLDLAQSLEFDSDKILQDLSDIVILSEILIDILIRPL